MDAEFYKLEPEVAGSWGGETVADTSVHPPIVSELHYVFDGWLGDSIIESFPCFIVTETLGDAFIAAQFKGFELRDVSTECSDQYTQLFPGQPLPKFRWLYVTGVASVDDFGISDQNILVVSSQAMAIIREHKCAHCDIVAAT